MRILSKLMESARLSTRVGIHCVMHIFVSIIKFIKRSVKKRTYTYQPLGDTPGVMESHGRIKSSRKARSVDEKAAAAAAAL